jgi:hypothetical protein
MNTDKITTISGAIIAGLLALQPALNAYDGTQINWVSVGVAVVVAVWGFFTNKAKKA